MSENLLGTIDLTRKKNLGLYIPGGPYPRGGSWSRAGRSLPLGLPEKWLTAHIKTHILKKNFYKKKV